MKKKITAIALVVALLAVAVIGGTLAYFTDTTDAKTNTFTVGDVEIELNEKNWDEPAYVTPGETYAKDPTVTNTGTNAAWVRVNVTLSDYEAFAAAAAAHNITDLATIFNGHNEEQWTLAGTPVVDTTNDTVTYSYYFNATLAKGESTSALFESVTIPGVFTSAEMEALTDKENDDDDFTITVTADAIQVEGFATPAEAFAAFDAQSN